MTIRPREARRTPRTPALVALAALLAVPALGSTAEPPDLSTPRRTLRFFVDSARAGDYAAAARALDPSGLSERSPATRERVARELELVLEDQLWIEWDRVSDAPGGDPADGAGADADVVGSLALGGKQVPVRLVRGAGGEWRLGRGLVAAVPRLYAAYGPGWLGDRMPQVLLGPRFLGIAAWQWIGLFVAAALALFVAVVIGSLARRMMLNVTRRTRVAWDDALVVAASGPAEVLLGIATFFVVEQSLRLAVPARQGVDRLLRVLLIATVTWAVIRALAFVAGLLSDRLDRGGDPLAARGAMTQIMVLKRVLGVVAVFLGGALVLMQFDGMRAVGTSLLASAGVAGLVIGLAAQRSIGMLLAGIQISFTQPVRVGDVVVIEGEWGTIEEITLTYVVVKVWDLRRLVVPITKILDAPFQNWTRSAPDIMGTVLVYADYRVPVDVVRAELARFVEGRSEWDHKVVGLQVTDATDRTLQLRALVSSADASKNWDLRCAVREHLVGFLQGLEGGRYLPRTRVDVEPPRLARGVLAAPDVSGEAAAAGRGRQVG